MTEDATITQDEFDRVFADSAGPYLRMYVALRLRERAVAVARDEALEEVYASLLATGALVWSGDRQGFQTRIHAVVDRVLAPLGEPALRKPRSPALLERARRFVALVAERWHSGYEEQLDAIDALRGEEREALLLRDFHEWTMQEIAAKLRRPVEETRAFVNGVRARIRERPRALPGASS